MEDQEKIVKDGLVIDNGFVQIDTEKWKRSKDAINYLQNNNIVDNCYPQLLKYFEESEQIDTVVVETLGGMKFYNVDSYNNN